MPEKTPFVGEEALDTATGRAVWWDGLGWSYAHPEPGNAIQQVPADLPPLSPQPRPARLPLSYAQQRLWFINQLQKNTSEYNMPTAFRLRGKLVLSALEQAVASILERHEILRTTIIEQDGEPFQIIASRSGTDLSLHDLSGLVEDARRQAVTAAIREEHVNPFDLARGPLLRLKLLQLERDEYVLLWTAHHIVFDAWSQSVFLRELMLLYQAFSAGQENPLPPLPVQYADFALWQRTWLNPTTILSELAYWRAHLAGAPARTGTSPGPAAPVAKEVRCQAPQFPACRGATHVVASTGS